MMQLPDAARVVPDFAITLWPEWAWMIGILGDGRSDGLIPKRVENRGWRPPLPKGTRIAIHAGAHVGGRRGDPATEEGIDAVIGMFRRANPGRALPFDFRGRILTCDRSAIVCTATVVGVDREQLTGWDVPGAWHWRLADVLVLPEPVPCRGAQGLWTPDLGTREALARQVAA